MLAVLNPDGARAAAEGEGVQVPALAAAAKDGVAAEPRGLGPRHQAQLPLQRIGRKVGEPGAARGRGREGPAEARSGVKGSPRHPRPGLAVRGEAHVVAVPVWEGGLASVGDDKVGRGLGPDGEPSYLSAFCRRGESGDQTLAS